MSAVGVCRVGFDLLGFSLVGFSLVSCSLLGSVALVGLATQVALLLEGFVVTNKANINRGCRPRSLLRQPLLAAAFQRNDSGLVDGSFFGICLVGSLVGVGLVIVPPAGRKTIKQSKS